MGIDSELSMRPVTGEVSRRRGIALPAALFGLVAVSVMAVGIYSMTELQSKSVRNRESSARAMMLAEAGIVHALTVLRDTLKNKDPIELFKGHDTQFNTADDFLIVGYGLSDPAQIPGAGKNVAEGNYKVLMADDPNDGDADPRTDNNFRFMLNCTGVTTDGATATLSAVVGNAAFPGVVTEGNLTINGDPQIVGKCGGAHANAIAIVSGNPVVTNNLSATSVVQLTGSVENPSGQTVTPLQYQPPLEIPEVFPDEYCGTAAYTLSKDQGGTLTMADGTKYTNLKNNPAMGWKMTKGEEAEFVEFEHLGGAGSVPGTVCVKGNVKLPNGGGSAQNPLAMSIIATGSIQVSGNPFLKPSSADRIMFLSGADVEINGSPEAGVVNYEGLIYATSQCKINGNPEVFGQVVCKNKPNPTKTAELAEKNEISGNAKITYQCGGFRLTKLRILNWYQTGT